MSFNLRIISIFVISCFYVACKSTVTITELNNLKETVENNKFEFVANDAQPISMANVSGLENLLPMGSNLGNINLIGNPNFLRVKNDSIHLDMPYYGVRRMGGTYGTADAGLKFIGKSIPTETKFNAKKNNYIIKYDVKKPDENLRLTLTLFANHAATLSVISSHRNSINYRGNWQTE
ncbi:DUF4251 domain-containing protein [Polaribacter sp.]|uniref:DUF4251 domain-containing protein n=1 Tax=Polaribacter sp. TaxID=1920175 RepID=UPI003F6D22AB